MRSGAASPFARLTEFAWWWVDEGRLTPCCQTADRETVETDESVFDCAACPMADRFAALQDDPENARAWRVFHQACNRFSLETHQVAPLVARLTEGDAVDTYLDLSRRLSLLFDVFSPPTKVSDGA